MGRACFVSFPTGAAPERLQRRTRARPSYFVELMMRDGFIAQIKDYRHVPYILTDASLALASPWLTTSPHRSKRA